MAKKQIKKSVGHPRLFETPEDMKKTLDKYYISCEKRGVIPTIGGAAFFCKMGRKTFYNYEKKQEFSEVIQDARRFIEYKYEERCTDTVHGTIFVMKQYGYSDSKTINHSGSIGNSETMTEEDLDKKIDEMLKLREQEKNDKDRKS